MRQVTLCLLLTEDKILLAMKKRGFGEGKWNGVGGKVQNGESIEEAALREMEEEISVRAKSRQLDKIGSIKFFFEKKPDWNQEMHVFIIREWEGEPQESEEMMPQWFGHQEIPFKDMWVDDQYWMPRALSGERFEAEFYFKEDGDELEKWKIKNIS